MASGTTVTTRPEVVLEHGKKPPELGGALLLVIL
jgi:hypothetical protein